MTPETRRELFAHEYIKDLNGAAAARRIGVSATSARFEACRMLAEPEVQEHIADLLEERKASAKIDAEKVLAELAALAFFDPAHAYDENNLLKNIHEIPANVRRAIEGIEVTEEFGGSGDAREHTGNKVKVKFTSRGAHLERLMKHLGMLKEQVEVKGVLELTDRLARARKRTTNPQDDGSDLAG